MKFLFVHEVNWRSKVTYEIHDIPEVLSLAGHTAIFIDYPEHSDGSGADKTRLFRTTVSRKQSRAHAGSSVEVRTPGRLLPGALGRLFATFTFVPLLWKTLRSENIDAIVLYGVPTNGWQTVIIGRLLRTPVIFRSIDVSHLLRSTPFEAITRMAERFIYRRADYISVHNEALRNYCIKLGAEPTKISINYPRLDMVRFSPSKRDSALALECGIRPDQQVVFFRGTLYRFCGLELFLELFAPTLKTNPDVVVLIVGSGEAEKSINATVKRLAIQNQVVLRPFVNYVQLAKYICLADVSINTFVPSLVTDCALPGRVIQSLSCGIPVVSTPLEGLMSYTGDSTAVLYRQLDISFVEAINSLLLDEQRRIQMAISGRELIESKGDWTDFAAEFIRLAQIVITQ